jgi:UDP-N-acetylmuramoyl-L-alanyl-D-glutamate--2,6-diaminopimelate ligase
MTYATTLSLTTEVVDWIKKITPNAQLHSDSRTILPGDVFFAYQKDTLDGRHYIAHAIEQGAVAIVFEKNNFNWPEQFALPHLGVSALHQLAGNIANHYYNQPDQSLFTIAVTGTNGKTSCAQWLGALLSRLEGPTAVIGTLGSNLFQRGQCHTHHETGYTTPDAILLQRRLHELKNQGAHSLAIEASSIGLHQGRLNGLHIDTAIFTNFSRDHLDYHLNMKNYEKAKTLLFDWPHLRNAVINADDTMGLRLLTRLQKRKLDHLIAYTTSPDFSSPTPTLRAQDIRVLSTGTQFYIDSPLGSGQVKTQLFGQFNVSNVLGILGALLTKGISWRNALSAIETLEAAPGRMQQLGGHDTPLIIVDYAHTPDALEKTLHTLHKIAQERQGKLWCLFGCGGNRDAGKRPQMGAISELADYVVVTSDNPRFENPNTIIEQIIDGMTKNAHHITPDRAAAILWTIKHANKEDVVLLAGKGHETYQEIMGKKFHFSDQEHAALALADRLTFRGSL